MPRRDETCKNVMMGKHLWENVGRGRSGWECGQTWRQVLLKVKEKGGGVEASQNAVLYLYVLSGCGGVLETTLASRGVQHLPGTGLHWVMGWEECMGGMHLYKLSSKFQSMAAKALGSVTCSVAGLSDTVWWPPQWSINMNSAINYQATKHQVPHSAHKKVHMLQTPKW